MITPYLLAALLSAPAAAAPLPADPLAAAFLPSSCPTALSTAAWRRGVDPYLSYWAPAGWLVADRLGLWMAPISTTSSGRLSVYLDYSLKGTTVPVLSLYGATTPGRLGAAGVLLDENLASSRARGDDVLGRAGSFLISGISTACVAGVIELNARQMCVGGPDAVCRRPLVFLDCGVVSGAGLTVTALLPAYPVRGRPEGKAAQALAEVQAFVCGLEYLRR